MGLNQTKYKTKYTQNELQNMIQIMKLIDDKDFQTQLKNLLFLQPCKIHCSSNKTTFVAGPLKDKYNIQFYLEGPPRYNFHTNDIVFDFNNDVSKLIHDLYQKSLEYQSKQIKKLNVKKVTENNEKLNTQDPPPYTYNSNIDEIIK